MAPVEVAREKGMNIMVMGSVYFNPVKAGFLGAGRGAGKFPDQLFTLGECHFPGGDKDFSRQPVTGQGRRHDTVTRVDTFLARPPPGAGVHQLEKERTPVLM